MKTELRKILNRWRLFTFRPGMKNFAMQLFASTVKSHTKW